MIRAGNGTTDGYDTITGFRLGFPATPDRITFTTNAAKVGGVAVTDYSEGGLPTDVFATTGFQVLGNNMVVANAAIGPTEAEIETYLGDKEIFHNGATGDAIYIAADNGVDTFIFLITEGADGVGGASDKQFDAAQDTGIAIMRLTNLNNVTALFSGNFSNFTSAIGL